MLKISKAQMEGFRRASAQSFESRMVEYLKGVFPDVYSSMGDAGARELIQHGMAKAEHYDIASELHICLYVCLMIELGRDFDVDPAIPWAGEMLNDRLVHEPSMRLDMLYDHVAERRREAGETEVDEA